MIIKKSVKIPLYGGKFIMMFSDKSIMVGDHYDDLGLEKRINFGHSLMVNDGMSRGFLICFNLGNKFKKVSHGDIAHEVFHACASVLDFAGCKMNGGSEEAYSYLLGWMTDEVYKVIKKNKIKIE